MIKFFSGKINLCKLIILIAAILSMVIVSLGKINTTQANYGLISVSAKAQREINAYCGDDGDGIDICQNGYIPSVVKETYKLLKNDIADFGAKTNIKQIQILAPNEVTKACNLGFSVSGCWDSDKKNVGYTWEEFTYPKEESYQLVAHEMLHAYATGVGFDVKPFEEGIVDNLALRSKGIALEGNVDMKNTGTDQYREMRMVADKVVEIYKLKGKGNDQNKIMINILKGGSKGLEYTLGKVNLETFTKVYESGDTTSCELQQGKAKEINVAEELTLRTYCLYWDKDNVDYYKSAMGLLDKAKQKIQQSGKKPVIEKQPIKPADTSNLSVFPQLVKEEQKINLSYEVNNQKVKGLYILISQPNSTLTMQKENLCKFIKTPGILKAKNGLYFAQYQPCLNGTCKTNLEYSIPKSELTDNYKLKVVSFITSDISEGNCESNNIIDIKQTQVEIDKGATVNSNDSAVPGKMKGKARINTFSQIDKGDRVVINVELTDHKDDELMLWITDCDGTLVPKILMSDRRARNIPSDPFTYHYIWDTQAAQTKICKHTVQVKVFSKEGTAWKWSDQAKYDVKVGDKGVDSKMVCIMQLEDLEGQQGNYQTEDFTGNTKEDKTSLKPENISDDKNVYLRWNAICGAQYYYVYRDGKFIGKTKETKFIDPIESEGEYKYKVDAYLGAGPLEAINDSTGGNDSYDFGSISRKFLDKFRVFGFLKTARAADTPVTSKDIVVRIQTPTSSDLSKIAGTNNVCGAGQTQLGVPIPIRDTNGHYSLKYCVNDMKEYLQGLYLILVVIAGLSAVLMTIYGGYLYVLSAGDSAKVTTAKEIIIGALVGLALILSAQLIISTIGAG